MRSLWALVLLAGLQILAIPFAGFSRDLPAVYQVTGVAADDVLNIRAEPDAGAPILSEIAPDARNVEVIAISADGKWGMVSTGEGNGWASMRYLTPQPLGGDGLPRPMLCHGNEPFWSLALSGGKDEWRVPDAQAVKLVPHTEARASGGYQAFFSGPGNQFFNLIASRESCSDGMSDRRFGIRATLFITSPDESRLLSGCCTLDAR